MFDLQLLTDHTLFKFIPLVAHYYGVHFYSKHFEHIFDFLTPFSRPGGQIPQSGITS